MDHEAGPVQAAPDSSEPARWVGQDHPTAEDDPLWVEQVDEADQGAHDGRPGPCHDRAGDRIAGLGCLSHVATREATVGSSRQASRELGGAPAPCRGLAGCSDGWPAGDGLEMSPPSAAAPRPAGHHGKVADLAGEAVSANHQPAPSEHRATDTRGDRRVEGVPDAPESAIVQLSEQRQLRVEPDPDLAAEATRDLRSQREPAERRAQVRRVDEAARRVDRSGRRDRGPWPDRQPLARGRGGDLGEQAGEVLGHRVWASLEPGWTFAADGYRAVAEDDGGSEPRAAHVRRKDRHVVRRSRRSENLVHQVPVMII